MNYKILTTSIIIGCAHSRHSQDSQYIEEESDFLEILSEEDLDEFPESGNDEDEDERKD